MPQSSVVVDSAELFQQIRKCIACDAGISEELVQVWALPESATYADARVRIDNEKSAPGSCPFDCLYKVQKMMRGLDGATSAYLKSGAQKFVKDPEATLMGPWSIPMLKMATILFTML